MQVFEWFMVSDNMCALAVNIMVPLLDGDDNGHQFTLMSGVIGRCTSQLLTVVYHWLQTLAHILLYNSPNATLGCICVNNKVTPQVRHEQHRCSAQLLFQGVKCSLISSTPCLLHLGPQKIGEQSCNLCIMLDKSFIEVAAAQEAVQQADFSR